MENAFNMKQPEDFKSDSKERTGLGVAVITRGWVSMKWMMHMNRIQGTYPVGMFWKYLIVEGRGWAEARIEAVHKAKAMNFEWLFFCDDDVFIPSDAVNRLLSSGKKIISGVYWTKTDPPRPVIFKRMGEGPYDHFPIDEVVKVAGSGLGCCLIHMSVFDKFDESNTPYFLENWIYTDPQGMRMKCPVGEDHYFFTKAKELGCDVWADTGCLCDHYDYKTKRFFPNEKIVRGLAEQKLRQVGRVDLIETHKKQLGVDSNKQTICFFNATATPFAGNELEKRGIGGSEGDVIHLSRIFANRWGFNVHVFCNCTEPGIYDNVIYHDIKSATPEDIAAINADLFILSRNVDVIQRTDFKALNAKKVCLWAHDLATDPIWNGIEKALPNIDKVFALTEWHRRNIILTHNIPMEKFFIARNGIDMSRFKGQDTVQSGKCIYSSTPYRGLDVLLEVWPQIHARVPYATLHVFSSMKVYGSSYDDSKFEHLYALARSMKDLGVHYFGTVTQSELAKQFLTSELLTYPNTYDETCCITVFEAQASGTPIVTSAKAALNETVPDNTGIKIEGNPYSEEYKKQFVDACVELLTNEKRWSEMHKACLTYDYSWDKISEEWVREFFPGKIPTPDKPSSTPVSPPDPKKLKEVADRKKAIKAEYGIEVNSPTYWDEVYKKDLLRLKQGENVRDTPERYKLLINEINNGNTVLDMGCGLGHWTRYIRKQRPQCEIWGSDISHEALDYCREMDRSIFYANHPVDNDEFESNYFDVITAEHLVEHFEDPKEIILKMRKIVKQDGKLILVIPVNDEPWHEHPRIWQMQDIYQFVSEYFPKDQVNIQHRYDHRRHYSDGRPFEEAMIVVKLIGGKEDESKISLDSD